MQVVLRHALVATLFAALASWLTFPLVLSLGTHVTGDGPGDNLCFLWNTWWFRRALLQQASLGFWSDALFAPAGTSLVLHTHTFLQAAAGAAMLPTAGVTFAHNAVLLIGLAANGWAAYALCFHYSRQSLASFAGGVAFASSTYVLVHVLGHVNLVNAWVIPLFALVLGRFMERPSALRACLAGVALAAVTYSDYYHALFCVAFVGLTLVATSLGVAVTTRSGRWRRAMQTSLALAAVLAACGVVVAATGGTVVTLGSIRISIRSTRNIVAGVGALLLVAAVLRYAVRLSLVSSAEGQRPARRLWLVAAASAGVLLAPIAYFGLALILQGDYVAPTIPWRSSPAGIDVATLVLGPPRHLVTGPWTQQAYGRFGIDPIEQSGWIGVVPAIAIVLALRHVRVQKDLRLWLLTAATFLALSLGPFLRVFGADTGLPLPFAVMRHLPLVSNARMPGRAIVMVQLASAVLTALALARLSRRRTVTGAWTVALLAETLPMPTPLYRVPAADAVDLALRGSPTRGAVLELPTGLRDGLGDRGHLDHRLLAHQLVHERPVAGGFVARLSPVVRQRYSQSSVLTMALAISAGDVVETGNLFTPGELSAEGLSYLVINRDRVADVQGLSRVALESSGFRYVTAAGSRELYSTFVP